MRRPPLKSMPKFRPWTKYSVMAMIDISADTGKLMRRKRMKSNLVSSGTMRSRRTIDQSFILRDATSRAARLDRHALRTLPAHPIGNDEPRQREGGEYGGDDADAERDG